MKKMVMKNFWIIQKKLAEDGYSGGINLLEHYYSNGIGADIDIYGNKIKYKS